MRAFLVAMVLSATLTFAAFAFAQPPVSVRQTMTIDITDEVLASGATDTLRFGKMQSGDVAVKTISLHNETNKPFVVVRHENSCGCATFKYGRKPVQPGEYVDIECTFDSHGTHGWQMKLVKFYLSGAKSPTKVFIDADVK